MVFVVVGPVGMCTSRLAACAHTHRAESVAAGPRETDMRGTGREPCGSALSARRGRLRAATHACRQRTWTAPDASGQLLVLGVRGTTPESAPARCAEAWHGRRSPLVTQAPEGACAHARPPVTSSLCRHFPVVRKRTGQGTDRLTQLMAQERCWRSSVCEEGLVGRDRRGFVALPHRVSLKFVGVVNDAVEDGVGDGRLADHLMPLIDRYLMRTDLCW